MDIKQINQVCDAFRSKYKRILIQSGIARFFLIILAIGIISAIFDLIFHFNSLTRLFILIATLLGAGFVFWWSYYLSVKRTWSDRQILAYLDSTNEVNNRGILELFELIKSEDIQETNNSVGKDFIKESVIELNQKLNNLSYGRAIKTNSFHRWALALSGVIAIIGLLALIDTEKTKIGAIRVIHPYTLLDWPSRTKITVFLPKDYTVTIKTRDNKTKEFKFDNVNEKSFEIICGKEVASDVVIDDLNVDLKQFKFIVNPEKILVEEISPSVATKINGQKIIGRMEYKENSSVAVGDVGIAITAKEKLPWSIPQFEAVKISALVSGEIPSQATIVYSSSATNFEIKEKVNISKNGNLEYAFPNVKEDLTFYIKAGDYETREQKITVIQRPFLKKITAEYKVPAYAGIPNKKVESGQLAGLEGTEVILTFESSMELTKAIFNLEEVGKENLKQINATTFTKKIMLEKSGAYNIELYEKSGFREARLERFEIKVEPDAKPEIEILSPGANLSETKNAFINVSFKVTDDFGIKSIGLYYKINEASDFTLLSDKISGPIAVGGKKSEVKFDWDFNKMEIPESGVIRYFVRAQDVNPTNKGITQSGTYEIELIKPSVYHQEAVLKAKVLATEAKIAWMNQLDAYTEGRQWVSKAVNKVDDEAWQGMVDKQIASIRALDALGSYLAVLTNKYERNRMHKEFMSVRLNSILSDIQTMTSKEMSIVNSKLNESKPKSDDEAGRIKSIRLNSQKSFEAHQKMSVLYMERILRKIFDWRDLQDTTIKVTNTYERQKDILAKTIKIAPDLIGIDPLDLTDEQRTNLDDLMKQQKSIYEAENSMEHMFQYLMVKAKKNERHSILEPLHAAFKYLRAKRVNDCLKKIDQRIADNLCSMVTEDQQLVVDVMSVVKAGLIKAGMAFEVDPPLNYNRELAAKESLDIEDDRDPDRAVPPAPPKPDDEISDGEDKEDEDTQTSIIDDSILSDGFDPITIAISKTIDIEDKVRARLKYLAGLNGQKIMPRLTLMKLRRMEEMQNNAINLITLAIDISEKEKNDFVSKELKRTQGYFLESKKLISAKEILVNHQMFIEANIAHLNNLIQLIARENEMTSIVEEHTRLGGKDTFKRLFLAQSEDLKLLSETSINLFKAFVYQDHINNGIARIANNPTESSVMKSLEQQIRTNSVKLEEEVKIAIDKEKLKSEELSNPVKEKLKSYDNYKVFSVDLAKIAECIKVGNDDKQTAKDAKDFGLNLVRFISNIKDLMDERVKIEIVEPEPPKDPANPNDFENRYSTEYIKKLIEKSNLPSDYKDICMRSLSNDLQGKYKVLLAEYFIKIAEDQGAMK